MEWIYISPHLDDVALSLGGLVWEQSKNGFEVSIWTICAGDPPDRELSPFAHSLHNRWDIGDEAIEGRRREDINSCQVLGADYYHFQIPDCIYRLSPKTGEHLYDSENDLWTQVHPDEKPLIEYISEIIATKIGREVNIVCPLTLGNHVDHLLARQAIETTITNEPKNHRWELYYYADFPYVLEYKIPLKIPGYNQTIKTISMEGLNAWQASILEHQSQISTFWSDPSEMRTVIQKYYDQMGGIWLGNKQKTCSF